MATDQHTTIPDGLVLAVEASTNSGSVALLTVQRAHVGERAFHASTPAWKLHSHRAMPMGSGKEDLLTHSIDTLLREQGASPRELSAIVCGGGPGSFTSLRIAASTAKGLIFALQIPLFTVPSLLLAAGTVEAPLAPGEYLVTLDALRGESYALAIAVHSVDGARAVGDTVRLSDDVLGAEAAGRPVVSLDPSGAGAAPHAAAVRWLAGWQSRVAVPWSEWEPMYGRLAEAQVKWEATHGRPLAHD